MKRTKKLDAKIIVLIILLVALIILFSLLTKGQLLKTQNLLLMLQSTVTVTLLAIGSSFLMISGQIDLSLGASGTFGAVVCGMLLQNGAPLSRDWSSVFWQRLCSA